jgi:hypothetical protein
MAFFLAIFGLGIALFQTLILSGLYGLNLKPKWIIFVSTPLTIIIPSFFDEEAGLFILFVHFSSVFILAIVGMVIKAFSGDEEKTQSKKVKTENSIEQKSSSLFQISPMFGIVYQLYVIVVIVLHIFIKKSDNINTELLMNEFFNQMFFQVFSIVTLLIISVTYFISSKIKNAEREFLYDRISNQKIKPFFSNRVLSFYVIIIGVLVFNYFFDIGKNIPILIEELSNPSIYNLYIGFFAYLIYQIFLIIIHPKEAALMNIAKAKTFFKSAYLSIFMAAALVPIFIILESQLEYFNMSSEIVLFLGLNIVLLATEIIIYKKVKGNTFTTTKL